MDCIRHVLLEGESSTCFVCQQDATGQNPLTFGKTCRFCRLEAVGWIRVAEQILLYHHCGESGMREGWTWNGDHYPIFDSDLTGKARGLLGSPENETEGA